MNHALGVVVCCIVKFKDINKKESILQGFPAVSYSPKIAFLMLHG
jgi:hypothetical protein